MIKVDRSNLLPKQQAENPIIIQRVANEWAKATPAPSTPSDKVWRGSWAGWCARQIGYEMHKTEPSNPLTVADYWRFGTGTYVHELLPPVVKKWGAEEGIHVEEEVEVNLGLHGYGHVDLVLETKDKLTVVEVKTMGYTGMDFAVKKGQGPKHNHFLQGAMYASGLNADELIIAYFGLENIGPGVAKRLGLDALHRFGAEYHYTREEFEEEADIEINRQDLIAKAFLENTSGENEIQPRFAKTNPEIPFPAQITNPSTGRWEAHDEDGNLINTGTAWTCNYCSFQDICKESIPTHSN